MKPISEILQSKLLAEGDVPTNPTSQKLTPQTERVSLFELENMYLHNAIMFNSINKIVQTLMGSPHRIDGKHARSLKFFKTFTKNIGKVGNQLGWESLLARIISDECIYGWAVVENVKDTKKQKIIDWDILDAKRIDYLKSMSTGVQEVDPKRDQGTIILDDKNRPVGYVQYVGSQYYTRKKIQTVPEQIKQFLQPSQLFFHPEQIALFKLYTVGDGFYPIGLIEPTYLNSIQKLNIKESITQSYLRHGSPILLAKVGNQNHEPTPNQIQNILEKLKNLKSTSEIAIPYYYDLEFLEANSPTEIQNQLDKYEDDEVASVGVPKPYATSGGESTNRATLTNQDNLFRLSLIDLIRRTCETIRRQMFIPVAVSHGMKETNVPCVEWDVVGVEEVGRKVERILDYIREGILTPQEGLALIEKIEMFTRDDLEPAR